VAKKLWQDMTTDEKLDALRADIARLFHELNSTNNSISQAEKGLGEIFSRVEKLEKTG
jgi:hypothetical protein